MKYKKTILSRMDDLKGLDCKKCENGTKLECECIFLQRDPNDFECISHGHGCLECDRVLYITKDND